MGFTRPHPEPGIARDAGADPDPDGVSLAAATATGVLLGSRFGPPAAWVVVAACLAAACLAWGRPLRLGHAVPPGPAADASGVAVRPGATPGASRAAAETTGAAGVLVLGALLAAGAAASSVRAVAVRGGLLVERVGRPGRVEVTGRVAEEPRRLGFGGHWVVLTVEHVRVAGRHFRTRERAGIVLAPTALDPAGRSAGGPEPNGAGGSTAGPPGRAQGRLAIGDRLRVRASLGPARWPDALGRRPPVVLRRPVVEERAPPAGAVLRVSEAVREAARDRALASLSQERAGLLVGMALGDTSLLAPDLERDFRAAGLTHLMAVSGANLAVVLAAGLTLAGMAGAGRRSLAAVGAVLVVLLVIVTRWEPSVLRAGVMAVLVLCGVASGRGPGGRRALSLAVVVLLLADPALAGALGFQLSVAATAGVLWLGPAAARALPGRIPEPVRRAVGVTLGAQATAAPALALALGPVSLAGLPANLLGLPLAGGPMLLGVAAAATAPVAPWAASLACRLADPFLGALIAVARWAASLPAGSVSLNGPARAAPAAGLVLLLAVVAAARRRGSPYLPGAGGNLPVDTEPTAWGRDGQRRRAPPAGGVAARGGGTGDVGAPDLPGAGQDVRRPLR